jgi:signal transduction histidine kinase
MNKGLGQTGGKRRRVAAPPAGSKRFEALLDKMSTSIARAPAHEIDIAIERWLREIVALDIDRSTVWERVSGDAEFVGTHWWGRPDIAKMPDKMAATRVSPWAIAKILAGETVVFSKPDDLPKETEIRRFVKAHGPAANVTLPPEVGGRIVGAMSFGKFRGPQDSPPRVVRRLRVVGEIIAGALDRKRTVLQALKLQEEVTLAARRSTMGQLAASIAHELNQPLGAILSNANAMRRMLSGDKSNPTEAAAALGNIVEDAKRAGDIIRRVRSLFKESNSPKRGSRTRYSTHGSGGPAAQRSGAAQGVPAH